MRAHSQRSGQGAQETCFAYEHRVRLGRSRDAVIGRHSPTAAVDQATGRNSARQGSFPDIAEARPARRKLFFTMMIVGGTPTN